VWFEGKLYMKGRNYADLSHSLYTVNSLNTKNTQKILKFIYM